MYDAPVGSSRSHPAQPLRASLEVYNKLGEVFLPMHPVRHTVPKAGSKFRWIPKSSLSQSPLKIASVLLRKSVLLLNTNMLSFDSHRKRHYRPKEKNRALREAHG